jgi:methylisocitrate lyase
MTLPTQDMSEPLLQPRSGKAKHFKTLVQQAKATGQPLMIPGAFNAITAKLIARHGFDAVYVSGAGLANGVAGYPDIGLLTQDEMARLSGYIARATHLPTIADADTGFGEAIQVFRTVQAYEREGLVGLHLEDQVFPKRCGHLDGKALISTEAMAEKLRAAVAARVDPDFCIIARTDAVAVEGVASAIARAQAYVAAGADVIFAEALTTADDFKTFCQAVNAPVLANMTEFGKTPYFTRAEFASFGVAMVIYPLTAFRVMLKASDEVYATLQAQGGQGTLVESHMMSRQALYEVIGYNDYQLMDQNLR